VASTFTSEGVLEVAGRSRYEGREAIRTMVSRLAQGDAPHEPVRPGENRHGQRHHVSSLRIEVESRTVARAWSYWLLIGPAGPDRWGRYSDTFAPVGDEWLFVHRRASVDGLAAVPTRHYATGGGL